MINCYMLNVSYDYGKYHELSYSVCDVLDKDSDTGRMCHKNFICRDTEEFVYQIIFKMIFPINKWTYYPLLSKSDYMNARSYIVELLDSDFAEKNKICISDDKYYHDKLYVFSNLLTILDKDRIENRNE